MNNLPLVPSHSSGARWYGLCGIHRQTPVVQVQSSLHRLPEILFVGPHHVQQLALRASFWCIHNGGLRLRCKELRLRHHNSKSIPLGFRRGRCLGCAQGEIQCTANTLNENTVGENMGPTYSQVNRIQKSAFPIEHRGGNDGTGPCCQPKDSVDGITAAL